MQILGSSDCLLFQVLYTGVHCWRLLQQKYRLSYIVLYKNIENWRVVAGKAVQQGAISVCLEEVIRQNLAKKQVATATCLLYLCEMIYHSFI